VRGRDYIRLKRWRSCKRLFAEATTTPTCLGIGEWVRSNPLRAIFVLVRLPKQGRQAKTAAGKRARSKKSKQAARSAREPWLLVASTRFADGPAKRLVRVYRQRMQIEAGFHEIKQEIGSAHTQTRNPDAVFNHLSCCMAATTITWIYAEHLEQAPIRRYASQNTTEYAFADVRRALAKDLANEGFGIDCQDHAKPDRNPLISAIMRLVA